MSRADVVGASLGDTRLFASSLSVAKLLCYYYIVKISSSTSIANVMTP